MKYLWETHTSLKRLRSFAIVKSDGAQYLGTVSGPYDALRDVDNYPARAGETDLCAPIIEGDYSYVPLIRESLDLACSLKITFLRQEDPGGLILLGGDLDNRIKTLFDALKKPEFHVAKKWPQKENRTYCLLESDTLVSGVEVQTGRLLFPKTEKENEVHLLVEVNVHVLRVGPWNMALLGD